MVLASSPGSSGGGARGRGYNGTCYGFTGLVRTIWRRLEFEILHVCNLPQHSVVTPGVQQSVQKSRNYVITKYIRLCIP